MSLPDTLGSDAHVIVQRELVTVQHRGPGEPVNQSEVSIESIDQSEVCNVCIDQLEVSIVIITRMPASSPHNLPSQPEMRNKILRVKYVVHMICFNQSEASIQVI